GADAGTAGSDQLQDGWLAIAKSGIFAELSQRIPHQAQLDPDLPDGRILQPPSRFAPRHPANLPPPHSPGRFGVRRQQTRSVWSPGFNRPNATNLECSLIATTDRLKPGLQTALVPKKLHFLLNSPA